MLSDWLRLARPSSLAVLNVWPRLAGLGLVLRNVSLDGKISRPSLLLLSIPLSPLLLFSWLLLLLLLSS